MASFITDCYVITMTGTTFTNNTDLTRYRFNKIQMPLNWLKSSSILNKLNIILNAVVNMPTKIGSLSDAPCIIISSISLNK